MYGAGDFHLPLLSGIQRQNQKSINQITIFLPCIEGGMTILYTVSISYTAPVLAEQFPWQQSLYWFPGIRKRGTIRSICYCLKWHAMFAGSDERKNNLFIRIPDAAAVEIFPDYSLSCSNCVMQCSRVFLIFSGISYMKGTMRTDSLRKPCPSIKRKEKKLWQQQMRRRKQKMYWTRSSPLTKSRQYRSHTATKNRIWERRD